MKKILIVATATACAALVLGCMFCVAGNFIRNDKTLRGSGRLVTEEVRVGAFDKISARHNAAVYVVEGTPGTVSLKADDNIMEYVEVEVEKGTLKIGFRDGFRSFNNVTLEVTIPSDGKLSGLSVSGASKIAAVPVLTADAVELKVSGASKLAANVKCAACDIDVSGASKGEVGGDMGDCEADVSGASKLRLAANMQRCDMEVSGASRVEADGTARTCEIEVSGASAIMADTFVTANCTVRASGASKASVNCTDTLNAHASSASKIVYSGGSTHNTIESSSAGSVSRK